MPRGQSSGAAAKQGKDEQKKNPSKKLEELEKENKSLKSRVAQLDKLEKEITSLKLHVAQLEENFDYKKICTKLNITEENMLEMMQDENAKLRARISELESSQISSDIKEGADNKSDALKKLEEQPLKKDKDMRNEKVSWKEYRKNKQELQKKLDTKINELNEQLNKKENELQSIRKTLSTEIENLQEQLNEKDTELKKLKEDLEKAKKADNNTKKKKENTAEGIEREELCQLNTKVETLKNENKDLKTQLDEAHTKITNLKTDISSRDVKQTPKEESDETTGGNERSENDDRALTIKERDEQIEQLENTLKVIETLKNELQTTLEAKETMIAKTESEKEILKNDLDAAKKENEKCLKDLNSKLAAAEGKIVELESQLEKQRDANNVQKHDHNKVKELEQQIKLNQKNHSDQIKEERESLNNELKQKDNEINELNKSLSKYESEVKSLKDEISKLESTRARSASRPRNDELKKAHEEIEELKTRLSKVMGDKITENNPDIADLSDLNRPTKLAERYSELYDNEWTDAFEELENNRMESRQILDELYNILKDVYIFSQKVSYDYDKSVRSSAIRIPGGSEERPKTPNMNSSTRKQLVDLKKTFAPLLASDVFKLYLKKYKEAIGPKTKKFIGVCTEICWLMSVQDPPVVLDIEEPNGRFDKDKYKFYQRSGKQVDFIVWPPMRLHEKGPLLGKGVAEGK